MQRQQYFHYLEVDPHCGNLKTNFQHKTNIFYYSYVYWSPYYILADTKLQHEGGFAHPNVCIILTSGYITIFSVDVTNNVAQLRNNTLDLNLLK